MRILNLFLFALFFSTSIICQNMNIDISGAGDENKRSNSEHIEDILRGMTRKPWAGQYSMRNRASGQRFRTFVGLMGKRGFDEKDAA